MTDEKRTTPALSVIAPVYNEADNVDDFCAELTSVLKALPNPYEIVLVNDGSTDGTAAKLCALAERDRCVKVVDLRKNFGQTAALAAGIDHATGEIVITIDADLQNDPHDIPKLLAALDEGCDVVSGWRRKRQDRLITRRIPSHIANAVISWVTGVKLRDYGCTLKAYRREVLEGLHIYGEMHRFLPAIVNWRGAAIREIEVNHRPRTRGKSKYGLGRVGKVILDLVTVQFLGSYSTKPIHLFGKAGALSIAGSLFCLAWLIYWKIAAEQSMIQSPLLTLSAMLFIIGIQFVMLGLLAEMNVRIYHESQGKKTYVVKRTINIDGPASPGATGDNS